MGGLRTYVHKGDFGYGKNKQVLLKKLLTPPTPDVLVFSRYLCLPQFFSSIVTDNLLFNLMDNLFF